jgi:hypothetical protein
MCDHLEPHGSEASRAANAVLTSFMRSEPIEARHARLLMQVMVASARRGPRVPVRPQDSNVARKWVVMLSSRRAMTAH